MLSIALSAFSNEIAVATKNSKIALFRESDGLLSVRGYGALGDSFEPFKKTDELVQQFLFYPTAGDGFLGDASLQAEHSDGDVSTRLEFVKADSRVSDKDPNVEDTTIFLKDPAHEFYVKLHFRAFKNEDVIQIWSKITNRENGGVRLRKFASASLMFSAKEYWLTQFSGTYFHESGLSEERLTRGRKVLESNLGSRAHRMLAPMFFVSENAASREDGGRVIGGAVMWPGSFNMRFDLDSTGVLRATLAADNIGGDYYLASGESIETPKTAWSFSGKGRAGLTRNFHNWARKYSLRNPENPRPVLLNNWEATHMNFDEAKLVSLFEHSKDLGVDIFLLDDGWFGKKYVRNRDNSSLGDWVVAEGKLPHGIGFLCEEAQKRGMGFGIWLEPEMISPKSELFESRPDWALCSKNRGYVLGRNQLVLDLSNPEVNAFIDGIFESVVRPNPLKYVKWDANCCIYQPVSAYLPRGKKGNAIFDYNKNLLERMRHFSESFPNVAAMLCSGGGGRVDFASLANFESFWASDNTVPSDRVKIQWFFMHFYPQNAVSAHITNMGRQPMKFRTDVAMSGALGYDIDVSKLSPADRDYIRRSIALYKNTVRPITSKGDYYRLKSPYEHAQSAAMTVLDGKAVVFVYQTKNDESDQTVKLKGLDPNSVYSVREIGMYGADEKSALPSDGAKISGKKLMEDGLLVPTKKRCASMLILLEKVAD